MSDVLPATSIPLSNREWNAVVYRLEEVANSLVLFRAEVTTLPAAALRFEAAELR